MATRNFIVDGNMLVEVNISIVDDDVAEPTESFTFSIIPADPGSIELSENGPFTVTITDNDGKSASSYYFCLSTSISTPTEMR